MKSLHVFLYLLGFYLLPLSKCIGGAVLGIDFGAEFYKMSLISNGKAFAIIENTSSKRKTPTSISFTDGQRQYEYEAANKKTRYPENTFLFVKKFLGSLSSNEKIIELSRKNYEQFISVFDDERQSWKFQLNQFKLDDDSDDFVEDVVYLHVEEIIAMILKHGKKMAEQFASLDQITDCVITVPSNWNLNQRNVSYLFMLSTFKMMIEAAKLAGLMPVGLIKENTAAALQYAIDKKDEKTKQKILFFNLGASQLQLSIADFNYVEIQDKSTIKKKQILVKIVTILGDEVSIDASSQAFDQLLANHFANLFDQSKNRIDQTSIKQNAKSMLKLLKQSELIKEKLSANKEALLYQENLCEGEDFQTLIHRSVFEQQSQKLIPVFTQAINALLNQANLTKNEIDQVEMIGGGVRIPLVQNIIEDYFGENKMGFHLNGDESMALGAAFMAANLSSDIRVKPLWLSDGYDFSLKLHIQSIGNNEAPIIDKSITLFPKRAPIGSKKAITFESLENIKMSVFLVDEKQDSEQLLHEYQFLEIADLLTNKKYAECNNPKLHFKFRLNSLDPVLLEKAEVTLKEKKIQQEEIIEEDDDKQQEQKEEEEEEEKGKKEEIKKSKKVPKEYKLTLKINNQAIGLKGLTSDQIKASKALLRKFDSHELFVQKNSQSKNTLESLIYKAQELLTDEKFKKYSTQEEMNQLQQLCEQNEDWLYTEEAKGANYIEVTKRVDELNFLINQIETRRVEAKNRPQEVKNALKKLDDKEKKLLNLFNRTLPWVKYEEKKPVVEMIRMTRVWIEEKKVEQNQKKINEDPAFLLIDMNKKMKRVIDEYDKIRNTPNPNQAKKEDGKKDKTKEDEKQSKGKKEKEENSEKVKKTEKKKDKQEEKKKSKEEKKPKLDKDEL